MRYHIQRVEYSIGSECGIAIVSALDRIDAASMLGESRKDDGKLEVKLRHVHSTGFGSDKPGIIYDSLAEQSFDCAEGGYVHHPFPSSPSLQQ